MKISVANKKYIEINIKNGRELTLLHNIDSYKTTIEKNNIQSLTFYDHIIQVNQPLELKVDSTKTIYLIKEINKVDNYKFSLICERLNKSSIFLLPLIAEKNSNHRAFFFNTFFYNAYIHYEGLEEYNDGKHLFLLYRFFNTDSFKDLEEILRSTNNFVKTYEPNKYFTCFIMEIPIMFQQDVNKILKGKYSNISSTAKSKIITFHEAHTDSEVAHILFKVPKLKEKLENYLGCAIPDDVELCSKPVLELESFKNI